MRQYKLLYNQLMDIIIESKNFHCTIAFYLKYGKIVPNISKYILHLVKVDIFL